MEIVLAVLLLFGSFTLGSLTADKGDEEEESSMALSDVDDVPASPPVTPITHHRDPTRCHSDKSVIYRDLSVPYHGQIERSVIEVSDCEEGRDCSYNPTARPSSIAVKFPDE